MSKINRYEVELVLTTNGKPLTITRLEHAYSPFDAMVQAAAGVGYERPGADARVKRVGPPMADIVAQDEGEAAIVNKLKDLLHNVAADGVSLTP